MKTRALYVIATCICLVLVEGYAYSSESFKPEERILHGEGSNPSNFRFVVRLHPGGTDLCGGSIISKHFILTAGHCVEGDKCTGMEVFPWTWRSGDTLRSIKVANCYKHDNYVTRGFFCDIGLIRTRDNLVDQLHLEVISLPPPNLNHPEGTQAVIAGWGMTQDGYHANYLMKADQKIYDWNGCNYDYQHADQCTENLACPVQRIPNRSRCAIGFGRNPAGSGEGDSGGPVIVNGYLVGVMSGTITNNGSLVFGAPTLYMNTVRFLPWINSYLYLRDGGAGQALRDDQPC